MAKKTGLEKYHETVMEGLKQKREAICAELGISEATFYNILNNSKGRYFKCSPAEKEVIARIYGLKISDLWPKKVARKGVI